jgi:hypothetical protein
MRSPLAAALLALITLPSACNATARERSPQPAAGEPATANTKTSANTNAEVGYDIRRLRPRNEEALSEMFERMRTRARDEHKRVAVLFSADWCEPCRVLDAELGNTHPKSKIGDVRILEFKEEDWRAATRMDEFNALRARWYPKQGSYPVLILLDGPEGAPEEMKAAIKRLTAADVEPTLPNWFGEAPPQRG